MKGYNLDLAYLCSENARMKLRKLSSIMKKSPQRLKYSVDALQKEGILQHPLCIFDYSYLGLILFRVYFKSGYISEKDKAEILEKLRQNPYIVSIYELNGEYDLVIEMESHNPSRFNKELKKVIDLTPTFTNYKIVLNVVTHIYPRAYLLEKEDYSSYAPREIVVGGDRSVEQFSKNEFTIISNLLRNPKIRKSALAKKADMNIKTVTSLIRSLQNKKILKGFKYMINFEKMGVSKLRLFLKLRGAGQEREEQLIDYMLAAKEIVQVNKTVGDWDVEIDIEAFDRARTRFIINEMREKFSDLIETFNFIEFSQYFKKSYLPGFMFQEG